MEIQTQKKLDTKNGKKKEMTDELYIHYDLKSKARRLRCCSIIRKRPSLYGIVSELLQF
jgi:hypothetical protein